MRKSPEWPARHQSRIGGLFIIGILALNGCATTPEGGPSTASVLLDVFGKLAGGIGAGISERDGNSAMAASAFIRNLQNDQYEASRFKREIEDY